MQRNAAGLRVVVPPVPSWWYLPKAYLLVVLIGGGLAAFFSFQAIGIGSPPEPTMFVDAGLYGFVAIAAVAHAMWRLRHRIVLDVTRDTFALAFVNRSGRGRRAVWNRCEVRDVKLNRFNGKLLIRIDDQDFIERPICPDREVVQWVADTVREAVFNGGFEAMPAAGGGAELFPGPRPPAFGVWVRAFAVPIVLALLAVPFLAFHGRSQLALAIIIASFMAMTILCGITYGTQDKDYFT